MYFNQQAPHCTGKQRNGESIYIHVRENRARH